MGVEYLQANLTAGELAPTLHARTDVDKYNNGIKTARNMVILPHGGLRRRPGLAKIEDSQVASEARLLPFVFNTTQQYIVCLRHLVADIYRDGVLVSSEVTPFTLSELYEVDAIQSADTMIFCHENHYPQQLQRQGSDTNWSWADVVFTSAPRYSPDDNVEDYINKGIGQTVDITNGEIVLNVDGNATNGNDNTFYKWVGTSSSGTGIDLATIDYTSGSWSNVGTYDLVWSASAGYPRTATFFGSRLWFAGTTTKPTSIWGSKINGFFDFALDSGADDHGIADILDSDQYNIIQTIYGGGRSLQVFTSGAEFTNTADFITPTASSWRKETMYGSAKVRPVSIDGATLYVDSSTRTVRQFLYDYNEAGHVSINASLLSSHLITEAIAMDVIKGTKYDVGDYLYLVNADGTVAVLNSMRHENITGWTHWETEGNFKDVIVLNKEVYFLVERGGNYYIELLTEETYTDHNVVKTDYVTPFQTVQTDYEAAFLSTTFKVVADFSMMADAQPTGTAGNNSFTINRDANRIEVGLDYSTLIETLPVATTLRNGSTLHRRKRVVKVDINVQDSLGVYARERYSGDREFTVVLNESPELFTGFKEMFLLGYNRITEIEISQKNPLPFTLRAIGYEIVY